MRITNQKRETAGLLLKRVEKQAKQGFNPLKASYGETVILARKYMPEIVEVMEEYVKRPYKSTMRATQQDGLCEEVSVARSVVVKSFKVSTQEQIEGMVEWGVYQHESYLYNLIETVYDMSLLVEDRVESTFRQDYELQKSIVKIRDGLYIAQYQQVIIAVDTQHGEVYRLKDTYKHKIKQVSFRVCKHGAVETEVVVPCKIETYFLTEAIINYELVDYEWVCLTEEEKGLKYEKDKVYRRVQLSSKGTDPYGKGYYIGVHHLVGMCEWGYNIIKHCRSNTSILTVDHINGDSLDNRVGNLRVLTRVDNTSISSSRDKRGFDWVEFFERVERDRVEAESYGKGHYSMLKEVYSDKVEF